MLATALVLFLDFPSFHLMTSKSPYIFPTWGKLFQAGSGLQKLIVSYTSRSTRYYSALGVLLWKIVLHQISSLLPEWDSDGIVRILIQLTKVHGPNVLHYCCLFYAMLSYESALNHCSQHSNEPLQHNNIMNTAVVNSYVLLRWANGLCSAREYNTTFCSRIPMCEEVISCMSIAHLA